MPIEEDLKKCLINEGFSVKSISREETWALAADWLVVFGGAWEAKCRMRTLYRALNEYLQQTAEDFHIVPLSSWLGGPPEICHRNRFWQGLECRGNGPLPDLSAFANLEFSVSPPDFSWTLVHTHEDHSVGGPYFIRREWAEAGRRG